MRPWRATTRSSTSRSSARRISIACSSRRRSSSRSSAATRRRAAVHSDAPVVDDLERLAVRESRNVDGAGRALSSRNSAALEVFVRLGAFGQRAATRYSVEAIVDARRRVVCGTVRDERVRRAPGLLAGMRTRRTCSSRKRNRFTRTASSDNAFEPCPGIRCGRRLEHVLSEEAVHCFSEFDGAVDERVRARDVRADLDEVLGVAVRREQPPHLGCGARAVRVW